MKRRNQIALAILKIAVTAAAVYWLVARVEIGDVVGTLSKLDAWVLVAGILLHTVASIAGATRWWLLFRHTTRNVPFSLALPSYYLGLFFNNVLPSSVGGDVVRTLHLGMHGLDARALLGSAIVDRGIGLMVTLVLGSISLAFVADVPLQPRDQTLIAGIGIAAILGLLIFFSPLFTRAMQRLAQRYKRTRVRAFLLETIKICQSYRAAHRQVFAAVLLTLLAQSLVIVVYYVLAVGLGIALPLEKYFVIVPVVFLAASIPISVGGLGVREGVLVVLMMATGVDRQAATALSLCYLLVLLITSLPGGMVFLMNRSARRR